MIQKYILVVYDLTIDEVRMLRDTLYYSEMLSEHEKNNLGFIKMNDWRKYETQM